MKSPSHQMKRAGLAASLCFGLVLGMSAQLDAGRTNKTKIIDALAIMPAKDSVVYKQTMRDLLSTGNAGLAELIEMRKSAKGEMLVKLDYMLNSLADYAGDQKNPALADLLQQVYMQAVKDAPTAETAAFYFKQLKTVGTNRAVTFLQTYLSNPQLSEFAAQTLSAIGTGEAADALKTELPGVQASLKKHLINALGEMQAAETEELLLSQKSALSADDLSVLYFALSNSGSYKALTELQSAASAVNYAYDKNGATDAYLQLVERLGKSGDRKLVQKTTKNLLKVGEKTGNTALRCAALTILAETDSLKCTEMIIDALGDDNRMYRNTAFYYINQSDRAKVIPALCKKLPKASEEIQSDLLSWCGKYQIKEALPAIVGLMRSENNEIAVAAIQAAALIGGETAVEALAGLMVNGNAVQISRAKEVLGYTKGDVGNALMAKLKHATPEGKAAILTMVASQKDTSYAAQFISLCNDADPLIRKTAVTNLDKVVTATHLPELFKMLRGGNTQEIKSFQKAVMAAVASMPVSDRFTAIQKQMQQESADKQGRYYLLMTAAPVQSSLDLIEAGCKTSDLNLKKDAIEALCSWNGPEVLDPLYSLCSNPQEASYFDQTWNAYVSKVADAGFTNEKKLIFLRKALDLAKNKEQKSRVLKEIRATNTFLGLFTAAKYLDDAEVCEDACQTIMNIALSNRAYAGGEVDLLLDRVSGLLNNPDKQYQQQAIAKYRNETQGKKGFTSLFNGKDLTGWKGLVGNPITRAKMNERQMQKAQQKADQEMQNSWIVENGMLVFTGKGDNLCTTRPYGDFEMYVDWTLDPEGPEPDAGIYLRGTPQVQIWDTARVNVGAQVGSGGLYNNQKNMSKPAKVADNRLGEWNSFFIRMVGERVSVWLNGEKVVDNVIMENYWDRNQPIPMLDQIELQAHGSRVAYRDIYLREIPRVEPFELSAEEQQDGFKVLFDGTSMFNWTGNTKDYIAEDGCIVLYPQNGGGGNLYTKEEYADFVFRFDFMLTPGANNGLGIRTPQKGDAAYVGMELQILDNDAPVYKTLEEYQYHGSVYGVIPAKRGFLKEPGEWNTQEVIANGDRIKIILNGEVILDGDIREAGGNGTLDKRAHPGLFNKKGHIAFLGHGSVVKFKNVRVKKIN